MLESIVARAPIFLLVAARCFAMIQTLPLFSSRTVPRVAKVALAGCMAICVYPRLSFSSGIYAGYSEYVAPDGRFNLEYIFLLAGEAMIGVILGFFVQMIFAAFSTAGQFFAFQMGFSASEVYDSLSQVENPLMGQFFNFAAMLVFLSGKFANLLFTEGIYKSFLSLNAFSIMENADFFAKFMASGLARLFENALIIALPIMGSLFLINVTVGILTKAAPQMNLLSEAFPLLILSAFFFILFLGEELTGLFVSSFKREFSELQEMMARISGGIGP